MRDVLLGFTVSRVAFFFFLRQRGFCSPSPFVGRGVF